MSHPERDLNDLAQLQSVVDFLHWISIAAKLEAVGVVANMPVITGDRATFRQIAREAVACGVVARKDKATIQRVVQEAVHYLGKEQPPKQSLDAFVFLLQCYPQQ